MTTGTSILLSRPSTRARSDNSANVYWAVHESALYAHRVAPIVGDLANMEEIAELSTVVRDYNIVPILGYRDLLMAVDEAREAQELVPDVVVIPSNFKFARSGDCAPYSVGRDEALQARFRRMVREDTEGRRGYQYMSEQLEELDFALEGADALILMMVGNWIPGFRYGMGEWDKARVRSKFDAFIELKQSEFDRLRTTFPNSDLPFYWHSVERSLPGIDSLLS